MSYISAIRKGDEVIIWERTENGREAKVYQPIYEFYTEEEDQTIDGGYRSIYGHRLRKHEFKTWHDFNAARQDSISSDVPLYESDIPSEMKVLSKHYYNVPAPKLHVTFFDIEVDYNPHIGHATIENPYAPINSVALYHEWCDRTVVYCVPPSGWDEKFDESLHELADITICDNETDLLLNLIVEFEDSDVIAGWFSDFFDTPYVCKRIERVLGERFLKKMSFDNAPKPRFREVPQYNNKPTVCDLAGRINTDYLDLFKKYEEKGRRSYKLASIADEELPHLPKLTYKGSLHKLYNENFNYFVRYNIRDTEILKGLEQKFGYMALSNELYHSSTGLFKHVTGTLKLADHAIINYCHHEMDARVPDTKRPEIEVDEDGNKKKIKGALVLSPKVGMHDWIAGIDIKSLYPSSIISINISPETLRGQFTECQKASKEIAKGSLVPLTFTFEENDYPLTLPASEWRERFKDLNWSVSGYGTAFDQNVRGIIPSILIEWFNTRKQHQKKKGTAEDKEEKGYYDRLQYIYKIKLNSTYGALNNPFFRFHDTRMGESTTATGQTILRHQCAKANEVLTGEYVWPEKDDGCGEAILYGDTDSTYFDTCVDNKDLAIKVGDRVGQLVNDSFPEFMRDTFLCGEGYDKNIKTNREIISDRGIFVDKKRYILNIVDKEGEEVDELKFMGVETKKTTLPEEMAKKINGFVRRLLKGEAWTDIAPDVVAYKDTLETTDDIMSIGLPKGIQKVEQYTQDLKAGLATRLPGHIAAAIHYNAWREKMGDKESIPIVSHMKIKVFYLTTPVKMEWREFKSIALPTDIDVIPQWFLDNFTVDRKAHLKRLVDKPLENIIKAIGEVSPTKQSMLVDSLLEY